MIEKKQIKPKEIKSGKNKKIIPCELCGEPTSMLGTKRCDRCWELERRIESDPALTMKIIDDMEKADEMLRSSPGNDTNWRRFLKKRYKLFVQNDVVHIEIANGAIINFSCPVNEEDYDTDDEYFDAIWEYILYIK